MYIFQVELFFNAQLPGHRRRLFAVRWTGCLWYLTGAVLFQSLLIQDDHIPAGNAQYAFFLHGRNNYRAEALGRQGRLDDMGMIPSRSFQDIKVVVYENAAFLSK
jgi:hypothetical protein